MGFEASETIGRPPEQVWAFLTDWSRASEWMPGVESLRVANDGPSRAGAQLVFTSRGAERGSTITLWEPPKRLTLRSKQGGVTADYVYTLEPEGSGTRLTLQAECRMSGFWILLGPVIRRAMARSDRVQPARVRAALEGS